MKKKNRCNHFGNFIKKGMLGAVLLLCFGEGLFCEEMSAGEAQFAREKVVILCKTLLGKPYEYGASGPDSFDCSGFVHFVAMDAANVRVPKTAKAIYNDVRIVSDEKREVGDLVFFRTISGGAINHVGFYIGGGQFISAFGEDGFVKVASINSDFWKSKYVSTGQFLPSGKMDDLILPADDEENVEEPKKIKLFKTKEKVQVSDEDEDISATASAKNVSAVEDKVNKKSKVAKKDVAAEVSKDDQQEEENAEKTKKKKESAVKVTKPQVAVTKPGVKKTVSDQVVFDYSLYLDWSLLSPHQFVLQFRGLDTIFNVRYEGWELAPGFGLGFSWDYGLKNLQMPLVLSINLGDFIKTYAGPVVTFNDSILMDTDKKIKASVIPGLVGVSFITPSVDLGMGFKFQGVQDVSYSIYNNLDGGTLNFMESLSAGLRMHTGVKISFPLSVFKKSKVNE